MNRLVRLFCVSLLSFSSAAVAQNLGTGLYAFGSFDSRGFDSVNLGNLNTHFEIPIVNKQGRGLPFNYSIVYEGLIWSSSSTTGTGVWTPDINWGFHGQLLGGFTGYLSYNQSSPRCGGPIEGGGAPGGGTQITFGTFKSNYVFHDSYGRSHQFNYTIGTCPSQDNVITGDGSTSDGSGLTLGETGLSNGVPIGKISTRNGKLINPPVTDGQANGNITDSNGNVVTNNGNGTFTDTLGVTAMTIGGSGTAGSPLTLTYPVTLQSNSATTAVATVYYKTYTVQTNFGCSGITEYGANSIDLTDHITLADGSMYSFTYESTPGISGAVTGRLASVTLPTGGTISYSYSGGCNGNGINADGTVGSLSRTTSDGTKSYGRSPYNGEPITEATTTMVQDEKGNQSAYNFTIANGFFYETQRQIYQGAVGGSDLQAIFTCYNGMQPPCDGLSITPPIAQTFAVTSYNGGTQGSVQNLYDASGMLTSSSQGHWGSTPLQTQSYVYNALEEPLSSTTRAGSVTGTIAAETTYSYDGAAPVATSGIPQHGTPSSSPGNLTGTVVLGGITTTTVYNDTGVPVSTTTPNGTTSYSYDSTQTFVIGTTLPTPSSGVSLSTSASYDQQSGAQISATGMNSGQTSQVTQYDGLLRPTVVTLPNSGQISYDYYNPNQTGVYQTMGGGASAQVQTAYDAYGRKSRVAVYNGQTGNYYYQTDYCYDATGNLQFQSTPYQGSGWAVPKHCSGSGAGYIYDALGRVTSITTPDGTAYRQYNGRAVITTDVNGVQKIIQHDFLGRISAICEISSNSSMPGSGAPGPCGMDIAGTGFLTQYDYSVPNATTITQGAQTRTFTTDTAGRTVSVAEPERGTTTYSYSYNSTGLQVIRTRPHANQTNASVVTHTTTQYDSLGRLVTITYDDGTPTKNFIYDVSAGWAILTQNNFKGKLSAAWVDIPSLWASDVFSYDIIGNTTGMAECLPSGCGNSSYDKLLSFGYDLVGNLTSASDGAGTTTTYSYSPASEVTSITSSMSGSTYPSSLVSNLQNGPNGPISYTLGNGLLVNATYDALGRMNGRYLCGNSLQISCAGGTVVYGFAENLVGSHVVWDCDTAVNQCANYGYDEFSRLSQTSMGSGQTFSYVYDRYGNRWQQNAPQGGPAPTYSFSASTNQNTAFSYDAAGNLTSDGIHNYTYDAEGNIIQVDGGATATYSYNALNQRVGDTQGGTSREYLYNASGKRVSIWDGNTHAQVQGQYYWGGSPVAFYSGGSLHFQHQDWLGTERLQTSYSGSIEGSYSSLPWGDGYSASGTDNDPYHFAMLDHDYESSTEHAQFRQLSSTQGRWMSPDPYDGSYRATNPQSLNRYGYVLNNPLSYVDPLGLAGIQLCQTITVNPDGSETGSDPGPCGYSYYMGFSGGSGGGGVSGGGGSSSAPSKQPTIFNCPDASGQDPCMKTWIGSNNVVIDATIGTVAAYTAAPLLGEAATTAAGDALFARGTGLLNTNNFLRIGWGWYGANLVDNLVGGGNVFRVVAGCPSCFIHWHIWP